MYRGVERHEHVQVWPRVIIDDGMGGETSRFPVCTIERYPCAFWRRPVEYVRTDQGNMEIIAWGMLGDNADIPEGSKIVRNDGREYIVTRQHQDQVSRNRKLHLECVLHLYSP